MTQIRVIGRLSSEECVSLLVVLSLLAVQTLLRSAALVTAWFHSRSQALLDRFSSAHRTPTTEEAFASAIRAAKDFGELIALHGYAHEEHVVLTKDGYVLTLHRVPRRKDEEAPCQSETDAKKPVVYFHHGILMNSEVWVCLTDEARCLPFVLAEQGMCLYGCMWMIGADLVCALRSVRRLRRLAWEQPR